MPFCEIASLLFASPAVNQGDVGEIKLPWPKQLKGDAVDVMSEFAPEERGARFSAISIFLRELNQVGIGMNLPECCSQLLRSDVQKSTERGAMGKLPEEALDLAMAVILDCGNRISRNL